MNVIAIMPSLLGLAAALAWGAADFTGGALTRRANVYGVVVCGELVGLTGLTALAILSGEPFPPLQSWLLAGLAGLGGGFGLTLLYRAMAAGQMSVAAPVSAVLAAVIPALFSATQEGWPGWMTATGLALALVAIWLIARGESGPDRAALRLNHLTLPMLAGVTFGLFFILLHQASREAVFWPMIATRLTSIMFLTLIAASTRRPWLPGREHWPLIALNGLLDATGNWMYVLAGQLGRLDVAAVLSSLYPGPTVLLAWLLLKERIYRLQLVGILAALVAIVLISI